MSKRILTEDELKVIHHCPIRQFDVIRLREDHRRMSEAIRARAAWRVPALLLVRVVAGGAGG